MIVSKKISFDAAHYLPNHEGKCKEMHGHHWIVELGLAGPVGQNGMVVDFTKIKGFLDEIKEALDHHLINDIIPNPTAENLCFYIRDKLGKKTGDTFLKIAFIKVWETEDSCASIEGSMDRRPREMEVQL